MNLRLGFGRFRARHAANTVLVFAAFALLIAVQAPICPSAGFFGVPCPGCGLTRATLAWLSGDATRAFHLHPLVFVIAPVYVSLIASAVWAYVRMPAPEKSALEPPDSHRERRRRKHSAALSFLGGALIVALLGVWVARFFGAWGGPVSVTTYTEWWSGAQHEANHQP